MLIKTRWFAGSLVVTAALAACSQSVIEATSAGATSTTGSTGTGMIAGPCGDGVCTANQLCVHPACMNIPGEECILQEPDAGQTCPSGTKRGPQFDQDCPQPAYACVSGCPAAPPFCVDLPASCGGVASCGCLAMDPCAPSNSGACHDADISAGVLSCSLEP